MDELQGLEYGEGEVYIVVAEDVAVDVVDIDQTGSWGGTVGGVGTVVEDEGFERLVYGFDGNVLLQIVESVLRGLKLLGRARFNEPTWSTKKNLK